MPTSSASHGIEIWHDTVTIQQFCPNTEISPMHTTDLERSFNAEPNSQPEVCRMGGDVGPRPGAQDSSFKLGFWSLRCNALPFLPWCSLPTVWLPLLIGIVAHGIRTSKRGRPFVRLVLPGARAFFERFCLLAFLCLCFFISICSFVGASVATVIFLLVFVSAVFLLSAQQVTLEELVLTLDLFVVFFHSFKLLHKLVNG